MKAIETVYNGYKFRSRLEARWAVFFDTLGIEYQYEPEGFDLEGIWYLPDFWLPTVECWVEIKPKQPNSTEKMLARRLFELSQKTVIVIYGDFSTSEPCLEAEIFPIGKMNSDDNPFYGFVTRLVVTKVHSNLSELLNREQWPVLSGLTEVSISDSFNEAFLAARQARFEHKAG